MTFSSNALQLSLLGALMGAVFSAHAQSATSSHSDIVVTATRTEQSLKDVLADVSLIDRAHIERSGAGSVADVLSRVPGLQISGNGGPGTSTSVFVRGSNTQHTAVFVDGVRIDSQSTGGATWQAIPLAQIDHIEVLRGPAAAIYGSDAVAGVIQIFTRKGEGAAKPFVSVGAGSYNTRQANTGVSGANGNFDYSLGFSKEQSTGFHVNQPGNPDRDGYRSDAANIRLGYKINAQHRIETTFLSNSLDAQYDDKTQKTDPGFYADDHSIHKLETMGVSWRAQWSDNFSTKALVSTGKDHYNTAPSPYSTDTKVQSYLWQNEYSLGNQSFVAALERREDSLSNMSTQPSYNDRAQNAVALGYGVKQDQHALQLNTRRDVDSEFGQKTTGSAAYAYHFTPAWQATASTGTAFRAPTLYQRFSSYGVSSLQPESSLSRELGLKYAHQGDALGLVVYRNKVDNLIGYSASAKGCRSTRGCYTSTPSALLQGATLSGSTQINAATLSASYDWLKPIDLGTGNTLARRANHYGTLAISAPVGAWNLGSEVQISGQRFDNASNTTRLGGYGLVNLFGTRPLNKDYSVLVRVNNLGDRAYQLANNYNTAGRNVFVGLRWAPL